VLSKDDLRTLLENQVKCHLEREPAAIKLYAPEPSPERKPWRKRTTGHDRVYAQMMQELGEGAVPTESS